MQKPQKEKREGSKQNLSIMVKVKILTAASQMLDLLMWKNEVLAMFVTGDRTCCRA